MFKRKYSVTILDEKWTQLKTDVRVEYIPRIDELLYLGDKYYRVLNVVHYLTDKQGIFLIVREFKYEIKL